MRLFELRTSCVRAARRRHSPAGAVGVIVAALSLAAAAPAVGQITVVDKGDHTLTLSGVIQAQSLLLKTPGQPALDNVTFRRLLVIAQVNVSRSWMGEFEVDFGNSHVIIKNAYLQYAGWRDRGLLLTVGNQKLPFSRSYMSSGQKHSLTERPFTGDAHYGTLNRALGVRLDGWTRSQRIQWSAALGSSLHPTSAFQLAFDSPANDDGRSNEGVAVVGRLELHPFGATPRDQGDFHTPVWRAVVGVAAYRWWNSGDRAELAGANLGSSRAFELSGGLRGHGVSLDAEFEPVRATARADAPAGGLFQGRVAELRKGSVEGSYMVVNHRLELAAGLDVLAAAAYARAWRRTSVGATWFLHERAVELKMTYRRDANVTGRPDAFLQETFVQMLLVF